MNFTNLMNFQLTSILPKIYKFCKTHQHGFFIALCLVLTTGIGYNIGRIIASHKALGSDQAQADIYGLPTSNISPSGAAKPLSIVKTLPTPSDPRVVASKASSSKLYHHPWCSGAQRIKEANKLWFPTESDAIAGGYTLAANCQ